MKLRTLLIMLSVVSGLLPHTLLPSSAAMATLSPDAFLSPADWAITTIDDEVSVMGLRPSIAINPLDNQPWVTHYDASNARFGVAYRRSSGLGGNCGPHANWGCFVPAGNGAGHQTDLVFKQNGDYAIAYTFADGHQINLMTTQAGMSTHQVIEVAGDETYRYPGVEFAADGSPRVVYSHYMPWPDGGSYDGVTYYVPPMGSGSGTGTAISNTYVDSLSPTTHGAYASFDISQAGLAGIAFRSRPQLGTPNTLMYAEYRANDGDCALKWDCMQVDPSAGSGNYISLHLPQCTNCNDATRIAYYNSDAGELRFARYSASTHQCGAGGHNHWYCSKIDSVGGGEEMGVAMAHHNGIPFIAYYDNNDPGYTHGILKLASYVGPNAGGTCGFGDQLNAWTCEIVDTGGAAQHKVGQHAAMAIDSMGRIFIAYYDATDGSLRIASRRVTAPLFTKSYTPATVYQGDTSTVQYVIHNTSQTTLTGLTFSDTHLGGKLLPGITNTCGGSVSLSDADQTITLKNGVLAKSSQCLITATLQATANPGTYPDATASLTSHESYTMTATATLIIKAEIAEIVVKVFLPSLTRN